MKRENGRKTESEKHWQKHGHNRKLKLTIPTFGSVNEGEKSSLLCRTFRLKYLNRKEMHMSDATRHIRSKEDTMSGQLARDRFSKPPNQLPATPGAITSHNQPGKQLGIGRPVEYYSLQWLWLQLATFVSLLVTPSSSKCMLLFSDSPNPVTATDYTKFTRVCLSNYINITKEISGSKTGIESIGIQIWLIS